MEIQIIDKDTKIDEFGGKALGLQKLLRFGVKVPKAFVLNEESIKSLLARKNKPKLLEMLSNFDCTTTFAVRSSASNEDNQNESFAGMYETKLNVKNNSNTIIKAINEVYESKISARVQSYNSETSSMNVIVQEMINPEIAGVCFTKAIDLTGDNIIYIEYVYGLGEELVSGKKTAYFVKVDPLTLKIIETNDENFRLEMFIDLIQNINKIINQSKEDLDIEWCVDKHDISYFVQARPITRNIIIQKQSPNGAIASSGVCEGKVYIIDEDMEDDEFEERLNNFPVGAIMLAKTTETDYVPAMKKALGIITTEGSVLAHAAIIARELNIPCITGYKNAFDEIKENYIVGINTNAGTLTINDKVLSIGNGKEVNLLGLYIFDNIVEEKIGKNIVLVEQVEDEFGVHIEEGLSSEDIETIDIHIRKKYKHAPIILDDQKYLWYFEWKRFLKIPGYKSLINRANNIVDSLNSEGLENFKNEMISLSKSVLDSSNSEYDRVFALELGQALHFLINLYICNGIALQKILSYKKIFGDISVKELLEQSEINPALSQISNFIKQVENIRGTVWREFLEIGTTSDDYFDEREEKLEAVIEESDDDIVESFYIELNPNPKITDILMKSSYESKTI